LPNRVLRAARELRDALPRLFPDGEPFPRLLGDLGGLVEVLEAHGSVQRPGRLVLALVRATDRLRFAVSVMQELRRFRGFRPLTVKELAALALLARVDGAVRDALKQGERLEAWKKTRQRAARLDAAAGDLRPPDEGDTPRDATPPKRPLT
jgi:hypothetical protein